MREGRGRTALLIQWPAGAQEQRIVLEQSARYMDQAAATEGHLFIFNWLFTQRNFSASGKGVGMRSFGVGHVATFKQQPDQETLIPILPLVFYQRERTWRYSTEFVDLFPTAERAASFPLRFAHYLVDQSAMGPEETRGERKAQIAQLLMMAAYHEPLRELLEMAGQLLAQVPRTGGINYIELFIVYLVATQERQTVREFAQSLNRFAPEIGGEMITYAEELRQEGRQEGEMKNKIEMIESLLAVGAEWTMITAATGLDPAAFAALKAQYQRLVEQAATTTTDPNGAGH